MKLDDLSPRALRTIFEFGQSDIKIHVGPYGCGKTFALMLGLGLKLKDKEPSRLGILLCGKTRQLAQSVMGDQLTDLFGNDFKMTQRKADDPKSKDALLFGHRIYFGGMADKESIKRVLGKSYKGVVIDELTSLTEEHFQLIQGRLRGDSPHWLEASTNPDGPAHWLKKYIENNPKQLEQWDRYDRLGKDAEDYYDKLTKQYYGTPYYDRYVLGQWTAADGLVYGNTFKKHHIINRAELLGAVYSYFKIGVDYGINNPTVALLVGVMPAGEHIVLEEYRKSDVNSTSELVHNIIRLANKATSRLEGVYVDPSASGLIKDLIHSGLAVNKARNDVVEGIGKVNTMLNNDMLYICDNCKGLLEEMYMYSYKGDGTDNVIKEHDHGPDALRYLCVGRE